MKVKMPLMALCLLLVSLDLVESARLPTVGGDNETWGDVLNQFLNISFSPTGTLWPYSINNTFLSNESVNSRNIISGAVLGQHINDSTINTSHILDGTITSSDIATSANIPITKLGNLTNALTLNIVNITSFWYNYNQTASAVTYADALNTSQTSWITATFLRISDAITQYFNKSDIQTAYYNKSQVDTNLSLCYLASNPYSFFNATTLPATTLSANSVNTSHVLDGTLLGTDINITTNVSFNKVNATIFDIGLESKTAECSTNGCTAVATCSSGKVILFGYGTTGGLLASISLSIADVECTTGVTSCSATDNQAVTNVASVKVICARIT